VLGGDISPFIRNHSDSTKYFSDTDIINMLEFLIDNIFVIFGGRVFQQTFDIPIGTNCDRLLADLFLYWSRYEADLSVSVISFISSSMRKMRSNYQTYKFLVK
jgi:hypothetical protein